MIGLQVKYSETLVGSITSQLDAITDNVDAQKEFARQMKETFTVSNLLGSVFDKVFESSVMVAKAFDSSVTSFNKATGAGGKYNQMIGDVGQSNKALGISMADAGASAAALHAGFSDFTNLSDNMASSLTTTAATLEKVGVDSGTFAQNLHVGHSRPNKIKRKTMNVHPFLQMILKLIVGPKNLETVNMLIGL